MRVLTGPVILVVGHNEMKHKWKTALRVIACVVIPYVLAYAFVVGRAYSLNKRIDAASWTGGIRYLDISTEEAGLRNERALIALHLFFFPANFLHSRLLGGPQHTPVLPTYRLLGEPRLKVNAQPSPRPYPRKAADGLPVNGQE